MSSGKQRKQTITEAEREIPVAMNVDVVVAGGGPAGLVAAIAAARNGAKTLLIERYGFLGGMATTGLVGPIQGFISGRKWVIDGIPRELLDKMEKLGGITINDKTVSVGTSENKPIDPSMDPYKTDVGFDPEILKSVADDMMNEAGASMLLYSLVVDPIVEGNRVKGVIVENVSGRHAILAKIVVDATGDGVVATKAGIPFEKGREKDGLLQPMTLMFRMGNIHAPIDRDVIRKVAIDAAEKGELPLFGGPWIGLGSTVRDGSVSVNMTRLWGDATNVFDLTNASVAARKHIVKFVDFLKRNIPECASCSLLDTAVQIGVRETRRILGEYILTKEDILQIREFHDVIARGCHPIDIHSPSQTADQYEEWLKPGDSYSIPYRCLIPQKIENLILAGRCISTTHEAHASTRVMGTCMAIGQAAGTAAALAIKENTSPRRLDISMIQETLVKQKAILKSSSKVMETHSIDH
jgi:hypothetical protein